MIFILLLQSCPIKSKYLFDTVLLLAIFFLNRSTNSYTKVLRPKGSVRWQVELWKSGKMTISVESGHMTGMSCLHWSDDNICGIWSHDRDVLFTFVRWQVLFVESGHMTGMTCFHWSDDKYQWKLVTWHGWPIYIGQMTGMMHYTKQCNNNYIWYIKIYFKQNCIWFIICN